MKIFAAQNRFCCRRFCLFLFFNTFFLTDSISRCALCRANSEEKQLKMFQYMHFNEHISVWRKGCKVTALHVQLQRGVKIDNISCYIFAFFLQWISRVASALSTPRNGLNLPGYVFHFKLQSKGLLTVLHVFPQTRMGSIRSCYINLCRIFVLFIMYQFKSQVLTPGSLLVLKLRALRSITKFKKNV